MYVVILAGGGGTRLRPLSRDERPKPFLPLLGERTLLQQTVDRVRRLVSDDVHVVTDTRYADLVRGQVPDAKVIAEPMGRNTAAAIALATLAIDRPEGHVMIVLPADHAIDEPGIFEGVLRSAARHLAAGHAPFGIADPLVTLGIHIDRPATEYGYLRPNLDRGNNVDGLQAYPLEAFEEKPTAERAAQLFTDGEGVAWNAGMFLWRRRAIRNALASYTSLLSALAPAVRSGDATALGRVYEGLPSVSVDYAVMEPAARDGRAVMASLDVGWSDIGGWGALLARLGAEIECRIVAADEPADLDRHDLAIAWNGDRHVIHEGPGTIRGNGPIALLVGAAAERALIDELLARVATQAQSEAHGS